MAERCNCCALCEEETPDEDLGLCMAPLQLFTPSLLRRKYQD